ncbi:MAG: alcohol dehydrogenase catalytic domain-containing protein [Firmicutes bacterium]|nr:alcohol dehydrogenase catalytic domain-containing protein [Bacillota bacterium]
MIAFAKTGRGAGEAGLVDRSDPHPGPGEVCIRISACGICGSDLHVFRADPGYEWVNPPVVLGHECAGTVAKAGPGVTRFRPGDRVVPISVQGCLQCRDCRAGRTNRCPQRRVMGLSHDGAMAEFAIVREEYLLPVSEELPLETAALAEPLSVAVHAVARARLGPGDVAVVSGPGPIGLFCALVAQKWGAEVVLTGVERDEPLRLETARRHGLRTVNVERSPLRESIGRRPNRWIEASGSTAALDDAFELLIPGGQLVVVGLYPTAWELPLNRAVRDEVTVAFSYGSTYRDYEIALQLLGTGMVDADTLVARYPLRQAARAFADLTDGSIVKALLVP